MNCLTSSSIAARPRTVIWTSSPLVRDILGEAGVEHSTQLETLALLYSHFQETGAGERARSPLRGGVGSFSTSNAQASRVSGPTHVGGEKAPHRLYDGGQTWDIVSPNQSGILDGEIGCIAKKISRNSEVCRNGTSE